MLLEHPRLGAVSLDEFGEIRSAWELTIKLEILKVSVRRLRTKRLTLLRDPTSGPSHHTYYVAGERRGLRALLPKLLPGGD